MNPETPDDVKALCLFAWVGEDELGSGLVGVKQGLTPAGLIPLAGMDEEKLRRTYILKGLMDQASKYGKTIRLCKFQFVEEVLAIEPVGRK